MGIDDERRAAQVGEDQVGRDIDDVEYPVGDDEQREQHDDQRKEEGRGIEALEGHPEPQIGDVGDEKHRHHQCGIDEIKTKLRRHAKGAPDQQGKGAAKHPVEHQGDGMEQRAMLIADIEAAALGEHGGHAGVEQPVPGVGGGQQGDGQRDQQENQDLGPARRARQAEGIVKDEGCPGQRQQRDARPGHDRPEILCLGRLRQQLHRHRRHPDEHGNMAEQKIGLAEKLSLSPIRDGDDHQAERGRDRQHGQPIRL